MRMPAERTAASRFDLRGSLRGAATAALLMLGLSFPILAYRVNANFSNELVLRGRWSAVAIVVAATFILRFLTLVFSRHDRRATPARAFPPGWVASLVKRVRRASAAGIDDREKLPGNIRVKVPRDAGELLT
jgi:hypothetical protein